MILNIQYAKVLATNEICLIKTLNFKQQAALLQGVDNPVKFSDLEFMENSEPEIIEIEKQLYFNNY